MPFQLVGTSGAQTFALRAAEGGALVLGRSPGCDLPVLDPTISRRHAELAPGPDGIAVRDLESSNGTFVNGTRVTTGRLVDGDLVTFGKVTFQVRALAPAAEPAPPAPGAQRMGATILRELPVGVARDALARALRRGGRHDAATPDASRTPEGSGAPEATEATEATTPAVVLPTRDQRTLELLLEVAKGLARARDVDVLLRDIAGIVFEVLEVDRLSILLVDDAGELAPRVSRDVGGAELETPVPRSIARRAVEERVAILSDDAPEDTRFGGESIIVQKVRSAICVPLLGQEGRVLGVLYVDHLTLAHRYTEEDLGFLAAFAGIAGVALENSQFAERIRRQALVRSNFERYFAPSLAERIANAVGEVRLGGDRRPVAVLISDIRDFTPLAESMRPDEIASLLTEYFTQMVECVFRHGGTLDKFMGDAVLAQWGAPIAGERDADAALAAAMDMMRAIDTLNAAWAAQGRPQLGVGIGLSYGEAFAGNIGSERRLEYTVIGDIVNVASRLSRVACAGEILVSGALRDALGEPPPMEERPPLALKGKSQPVRVWRVAT